MGWYEAVGDALTVADRLRDSELQQRMANVQMECAKLAEENARMRQELIDLRGQVQAREEMHYRDNVYWRPLSRGRSEGPFCPKCFDGNNKASRMTDPPSDDWWKCPVCNCVIIKPGKGYGSVGKVETECDPFSG